MNQGEAMRVAPLRVVRLNDGPPHSTGQRTAVGTAAGTGRMREHERIEAEITGAGTDVCGTLDQSPGLVPGQGADRDVLIAPACQAPLHVALPLSAQSDLALVQAVVAVIETDPQTNTLEITGIIGPTAEAYLHMCNVAIKSASWKLAMHATSCLSPALLKLVPSPGGPI